MAAENGAPLLPQVSISPPVTPAGFLCTTTSSPRHKAHFGAKFEPEICSLRGKRLMTVFQAICLGVMLAWTPSLIALAWLLWEAPLDLDELQR